jgi:hypothetical protein
MYIFPKQGYFESKGDTIMKKPLSATDKNVLKDLQAKKIHTSSLEQLFGRINNNQKFQSQEKEYLKKILTENINNYYNRTH